jgi:hypothetical protein
MGDIGKDKLNVRLPQVEADDGTLQAQTVETDNAEGSGGAYRGVATPREVVPQIGRQDGYRPAPGRPPPPPPTVISVEQTKTPTVVEVVEAKKPSSVSTVEEPLRLEEEPEEFEEAVATEATTPLKLQNMLKHRQSLPKTRNKHTKESLRLEEEGPEEEESIVAEEQAQEEPKGRAGSRSQ